MDAMKTNTFQVIEKRLGELNPPVVLRDHIVDDPQFPLKASPYTLDGVTFTVMDRTKLLEALRAARDDMGQVSFAEGSKIDPKHWYREGIKGDPKHWALRASFMATDGIGFREIWRLRLMTRSLRLAEARPPGLGVSKLDGPFSAHFGDNPNLPDLSSLHCAVWVEEVKKVKKTRCNIHIDEAGFVMEGPAGEIMLTPDFLRHLVVELGWKTLLRGKLPDWAVDRVNLVLPSSFNDYSRAGLSVDLIKTDKLKLEASATCGIFGRFDCSGTLTLSGKHDIGGGGR